jgi:hypothetical protein
LGGTSVIITGTTLTGATSVKFGAANAAGFTVNSGTQITATSPAGTGTVDITATTVGGTSATSSADQFTFVDVITPNPWVFTRYEEVSAAWQGTPVISMTIVLAPPTPPVGPAPFSKTRNVVHM